LDFAPSSDTHGCFQTTDWVTAVADGKVVRSETGVIVQDLDGDGYEQTGWAILYLHIAADERVPLGSWVMQNERIGRPSCEGGKATGTHVHIARKYNGEWILADGPLAFEMSGWRAYAGEDNYDGWMIRGEERVDSSVFSEFMARISR
jgi:murein DD-endopeptidase MepM/ murein hydrolase activator NlpD